MKATSILMREQIKLVQPLLCEDVAAARRSQDRVGALEARVLETRVTFIPAVQEPYQADWAVPLEPNPEGAILYLHGGGYTAGSLEYARGFGGVIADITQRSALCLGYRLAPEHPFPAALKDALAAYRLMLKSYAPEQIAFVGESAGGGLCYALCLYAREKGVPLPGRVVAISPWTDLTLSRGAITRNAKLDPTLSREMISLYAQMYAPGDEANPLASPLFGDLTGLPPSMIFAGDHEILEDDARSIAEKLNASGSPCTLHIEPGGWHVYVLYGIYEARQALSKIKAFLGDEAVEG